MNDLDLSRDLTTAVAAVAGVVGVYPAGPLHRAVGLAVANVTAKSDEAPAKVAVSRTKDGGIRVEVAVGVLSAYPVPQTLRAVGDAVRARIAVVEESAPLDVRVSASHIETPQPQLPDVVSLTS